MYVCVYRVEPTAALAANDQCAKGAGHGFALSGSGNTNQYPSVALNSFSVELGARLHIEHS